MHNRYWKQHSGTTSHRGKVQFTKFEAAFDEATKDKHGISVSHSNGIDFGIVEVESAVGGARAVQILTVKSTVPLAKVSLIEAKVLASFRKIVPFTPSLNAVPCRIVFGRDLAIAVNFQHSYRGMYNARIEFVFEDTSLKQQFAIVRTLRAIVGDSAEYERLRPTAPFKPKKRTTRQSETEIVPGDPPPALNAIPYVVTLPFNPVPDRISSALSRGSTTEIIEHFRTSLLPNHLESDTYGRHFKYLLWAEEYRSECVSLLIPPCL